MANNYYHSIPKLLATVQLYIYNATEQPEIQKKMNLLGFTQKRLLEGKALLDTCKMLHSQQNEKYDEKEALDHQLQADEPLTRQTFADHAAIMQFVFRKEPATLAKFRVEKISKKVEEWTLQAGFFYSRVKEHAALLSDHGLTPEECAQATAMVEAVMTMRHRRMQRKGEAQQATHTRDVSLKALRAWMKDFRTTARMALKDQPQLLEALGIVVKTQKV